MKDRWFADRLVALDEAECFELLACNEIGRVAWCELTGPVIMPVNYLLDGKAIRFRTSAGTALARHIELGPATFQIDAFDATQQTGWSVMVQGHARYVSLLEPATFAKHPQPWAGGDRRFNVEILPLTVTGRRILPA